MLDNWKDIAPEIAYKISEESAKAELGKILKYYEADLETQPADIEGAINQIFVRLVSAIRQGKIELKENDKTGDLEIIQHLKNGDALKFRALQGRDKTRLDAVDPQRKIYQLAGILCGLGEDAIMKLSSMDLRITESIASFLLIMA